jgi:hypothetical protein
MFHLKVLVNFSPTEKPTGFFDFITASVHGKIVFAGMCSTSPNGFHPVTKKPWFEHYGWVNVVNNIPVNLLSNHSKFGECLIINNGKELPCRTENVNHDRKKIVSEVLLHRAMGILNPEWRGSAGCLTMHANQLSTMIKEIKSATESKNGTITIMDNL